MTSAETPTTIDEERTVFLEISLVDDTTSEKLQPSGGNVEIFVPYSDLDGITQETDFRVLHLKNDGTYEEVTPEKLTNGVKLSVSSLSPFMFSVTSDPRLTMNLTSYNTAKEVKISLYEPNSTKLVQATTVPLIETSATTPTSQLLQIASPGSGENYDVVISMDGHISHVIKNQHINLTYTELGDITLIAGDVNGDEKINFADLSEARNTQNYGSVNAKNKLTDLNGDGKVDGTDLSIITTNYNTGSGAPQ